MRAHLKKDMLTSQQICATNPSLSTWQDALLPTSSLSTYRASHIHWPISLYTTGWAKIMRYFKGMPSLCMSVYIPLCPSVPPSLVLSVTHGPHLKIFFCPFSFNQQHYQGRKPAASVVAANQQQQQQLQQQKQERHSDLHEEWGWPRDKAVETREARETRGQASQPQIPGETSDKLFFFTCVASL